MPYFNVSDFIAFSQIIDGQRPPRLNVPDEIWDLARKCWKLDPHLRPTPERVIELLDALKQA